LLRTVIDNLPDRIYVKDTQGRYLLDNIAHMQQLGLSDPRQVVGKTTHDFFPPEIAAQYARDDQEVLNNGTPLFDHEEIAGEIGGMRRWLLTTKVPLTDANGEIIGLVGMSRDITERKRAEQAMRESEERTRLIVETAQDAFVAMD